MKYLTRQHSAKKTDSYIFQQLIPYIGNKRKLLSLIKAAIDSTGVAPITGTFVDLFSGSGVVARLAKHCGFRVIANDWEPYSESINRCYIEANAEPAFEFGQSYRDIIEQLNAIDPITGWITDHLCPSDESAIDEKRDRMFYMRKNGRKIDAIRTKIAELEAEHGFLPIQRDALLAPLLYQACYTSNTSGVFKGFHRGWGGQTGTALYRIAGDLRLKPAIFLDNGRENLVYRRDATLLASELTLGSDDIVYIDPPYNQHPYGSNYHVLNTVTLWDAPPLSPKITRHGDKSAIRTDWRTERRSAYNNRSSASKEYSRLLSAISARWIITSYSTDGNIDLESLVQANVARGKTSAILQGYKRYRVSSTRRSAKPMNVEFVLITDTHSSATLRAEEIVSDIMSAEERIISSHPESFSGSVLQESLF